MALCCKRQCRHTLVIIASSFNLGAMVEEQLHGLIPAMLDRMCKGADLMVKG
jgi:hypothetical protein